MTPERLAQVQKAYDAVVEQEPARRAAILAEICAEDDELRAQVDRLLNLREKAKDFFEPPLPELQSAASPAAIVGMRAGPWQLLREIGRGGMGAVFLAERADEAFHKQAAVKIVSPVLGGGELVSRFRREREILAALDHPNIARLLDGGATEEGLHYLVMEYVEGTPITEYCNQHRLSVRDRLEIFRQVCEAVQYAHRNLVVHRDLKPGNIFVTPSADGKAGQVKLLDFGIARLLDPQTLNSEAAPTIPLMTPDYASPEQVQGRSITTSSDVYSLGVVLYELLTGERPYRVTTRSPHEIARVVCEQEPERPSLHVTQSPQGFAEGNAEKLKRRLAGDLDHIALKALAKDVTQRYASVEQLSEDIRRHLTGEPVLARKGAGSYRAWKFIRRHRRGVTLISVLILTLLGGISATLWQARIARRHADRYRRLAYAAQISLAQQALKEGNIRRTHDLLEAQHPPSGAEDLRGFEWRYLRRLAHQEMATLANGGEVLAIAFSPDGNLLAAANRDRTVRLWDVRKKELVSTLQGHQEAIWAVSFTPDGKLLATGSSDKTVRLWNLATKQTEHILTGHTSTIRGIAFTLDGRWMLTASEDHTVKKWNLGAIPTHSTIQAHAGSINTIAISPDGKTFASGSDDSTARLWDLASGRPLQTVPIIGEQIRALVFSPDGRKIALGTTGNQVDLWDLRHNSTEPAFGAREIAWAVAFSPTGHMLAAGSAAHTATLWDVTEKREMVKLPGHLDRVYGIAFSPDGRLLATASKDGMVKFWDLQRLGDSTTLQSNPKGGAVWTSALSSDGKLLAIGSDEQFIRLWDTASWRELKTIPCQCDKIRAIAVSPDSRYLATGGIDRIVRLWERDSARLVQAWKGHSNQIRSLAFSPDGRLLASASEDFTIRLWNVASGGEGRTIREHTDKVRAVAFSSDGQTLVSIGDDATVVFWSIPEQRTLLVSREQAGHALAFSPDGRSLAVGDHNYAASLLDAATGRKLRGFVGHANRIWGLAFSPDGKRLATAGGDRTIRIWDVETGYELLAIEFPGAARSVLFTRDGNRLVVTGDEGLVRVFDADGKQ